MGAKNIWVIGLALLLSPIPACAQMVCDIDCSLQRVAGHDAGTTNKALSAPQNGDAQEQPAHRHCNEDLATADSAQKDEGPVQRLNAVCHGDNCATELSQTVTASAQIRQRVESAGLPAATEMNGRLLVREAEPRNFSLLDGDSAVGVILRIGVLRI